MLELINRYLDDHKSAWAVSTIKSESSRLRTVVPLIAEGPTALMGYALKQGMKPYAIKTLFIRCSTFEKWASAHTDRKSTQFRDFMVKHANRFKHAYQKEELSLGFEDARRKIEGLPEAYRKIASELLSSGVRISESYTVDAGTVVGKGGKPRKLFAEVNRPNRSASALRKALRDIGLRPHQLRKLCATKLADKGATPADLCRIFGWSSITTAYQYLQPKDDKRLEELMK